MLQAEVGAASDKSRQVPWIVCGAGTAAEKDDGIVQYAAVTVAVFRQPIKEMNQLLAEKLVVFGEFQLPVFVSSVRQTMVSSRETQFQREGIADSHAVFAVEHKRNRSGNVGVERQCDQIEHVAIVFRRLAFVSGVQIQMRMILRFQRDFDPAF